MAKRDECYLCGGKLRDGYCPDCGLDNTKIRKKHYHLNESYAVESMNGNEEQEKSKPAETYSYQFQNTKIRKTAVSGKAKIAVAAAALAVFLIGSIGNYVSEHELHFGGLSEPELEAVDMDPYEYVERELSETGEHYETELGQGEYLVGIHLPEGSYTAELLEGRGGLSLEDMENGIYIWQSFGTEAEYDELLVLEDVRLYAGAHVTIRDPVRLRLTTENGQTEDLEFVENPLTETVAVKKDETLEVGDEIVPGVYDLYTESGWGVLRCRIKDDAYEEGYYEVSYWLSGDEMDDIYRNLYLKEGMEVTAEENPLELIPSEVIGTGDYGEYYRYY